MVCFRFRAPELSVLAAVLLTAAACGPSMQAAGTAPIKQSSSEISKAEVDSYLSSQSGTAFDMIRHLRPGMLVPRDARTRREMVKTSSSRVSMSGVPASGARGIRVYLDQVLLGGIETLGTIPANSIRSVRWLSPIDATTFYGTDHADGVIEVAMRH